jgi:hypothetical protein
MLLTALIVVAFRIEINPIGWKYFHWANWDCGLAFFIGLIVSAGKEVVWEWVVTVTQDAAPPVDSTGRIVKFGGKIMKR